MRRSVHTGRYHQYFEAEAMRREKPVVLLADDDKNITKALKIRLTHAGFEVVTANGRRFRYCSLR